MSGAPTGQSVVIRRATDDDLPAVLALAARALGWDATDATAAHFVWKHHENPFGVSELWVAEADGGIVGLRSFLRWELVDPDGRTWRAARAVDTATDAAHRRQGVFTRLTTTALAALRAEGTDVVFNTPNDQSRPANLTLGWQVVGRLPAVVRPSGLRGAVALARARRPASRAAVPCEVGEPAGAAFADAARAAALLARVPPAAGLATRRSPDYLRWRYGHAAGHYRLVEREGVGVVFRLRRRGPALEAVVCDTLAGPGASGARTAIARQIARESGADYLLSLAGGQRCRQFIRLPRTGPILTARGLGRDAPRSRSAWSLSMGDIEGF